MINNKMKSLGKKRSVIRELFEYGKIRKREIGEENVFDFSLGNPSVPCPEKVTETLISLLQNESAEVLHGYTSAQGDFAVRSAVSEFINKRDGVKTTPDCFYLTVGAAASLTSTLTALVSPGEEVIVLAPYFPEYRVFVERCGGILREVMCESENFYPDIAAIRDAVNEKTAAIIINSPNNPTGAVYPEDVIKELSGMLKEKEALLGKTLYLISDEPYRELVYGSAAVPFIPKYYSDTVVCYSYSKSLSLPGERIGYILVSPDMSSFEDVYASICGAARALGFVCAPSLMQKALPHLLGSCSDLSVYSENRRILSDALTEYGYTVVKADGAFYLFVKAFGESASEFAERAKEFELLLVPSDDFGYGGYVRIAYCVTTEQVKKSLPAFKKLSDAYRKENI
jgi:aspartate aminotransferase